jgi:hypothetical protein
MQKSEEGIKVKAVVFKMTKPLTEQQKLRKKIQRKQRLIDNSESRQKYNEYMLAYYHRRKLVDEEFVKKRRDRMRIFMRIYGKKKNAVVAQ